MTRTSEPARAAELGEDTGKTEEGHQEQVADGRVRTHRKTGENTPG